MENLLSERREKEKKELNKGEREHYPEGSYGMKQSTVTHHWGFFRVCLVDTRVFREFTDNMTEQCFKRFLSICSILQQEIKTQNVKSNYICNQKLKRFSDLSYKLLRQTTQTLWSGFDVFFPWTELRAEHHTKNFLAGYKNKQTRRRRKKHVRLLSKRCLDVKISTSILKGMHIFVSNC